MTRATRDRLHVLALGIVAGAAIYHLALTRAGLSGAGTRR